MTEHPTPGPDLKRRTIAELQARGLLRRQRTIQPRLIWLAAAATIVFATGIAVGYAAASRRPIDRSASKPAQREQLARVDSVRAPTAARQVVWF